MDDNIYTNFHGVYMLYCRNTKFKGRIYIGYTVNPQRRIKQHNKGKDFGGAGKTSSKGPWDMVLVVHGFPNSLSALRFEWAWQHPSASRRLKHVKKKTRQETSFQFHFRLMSEMLRTSPWSVLPLTLQWMSDNYITEFEPSLQPPTHMPICFGDVTVPKPTKPSASDKEVLEKSEGLSQDCLLCQRDVGLDEKLTCVNLLCTCVVHIFCLAETSDKSGLLPVEVKCPKCHDHFLWKDWIRTLRTSNGD